MNMQLVKISNTLTGTISLKGSKSISNRVLMIKELSGSNCAIQNISSSDDTQNMQFNLDMISNCSISGIPMIVDTRNAGTVSRFLAAFLIFREGMWLLTGTKRMRERPVVGLFDGLRMLAADISYVSDEGSLPVRIVGKDIVGGQIEIDASKSSQFISALMLIGPYLDKGIKIKFIGSPVSFPYIEMTQKLMQKFGAHVELNNESVTVLRGKYGFHQYSVEADWSSASYWYEVAALADSAKIFLPGLYKNSLQGDSVLVDVYEKLGVNTIFHQDRIELQKTESVVDSFSYDFSGCPDIVPAVMATCAALKIESVFKNIGHLAFKESNRIEALALELKKVGALLKKEGENHILIPDYYSVANELKFSSYDDHRIAMCLAPLVLKYGNVEISNPEVVKKSYPGYWDDFKKLKFAVLNENK